MKLLPKSRRARRRLLIACATIAGLFVVALLAHLGWLSRAKPWQRATGWDRIPETMRPPDAPAWAAQDDPPSIAWLGHSGFVIRWKGAQILLDPNTSRRCTVSRRVLEDAEDVARLGPVDAILISHAHFDHLDMPTILRVPGTPRIVLPRGAEEYFSEERFPRGEFAPLVAGECEIVGPLEICGVRAQHNGNRAHPFASRVGALGYVIRAGGDAIYYSGDTGSGIPFESIRDEYHPRLAILPIGAWLPRIPMKYYHLSPEEAVDAALRLGVETVVPCHFGTFALSWDRPSSALPRFARAASERGASWRMPRLLNPVARLGIVQEGAPAGAPGLGRDGPPVGPPLPPRGSAARNRNFHDP